VERLLECDAVLTELDRLVRGLHRGAGRLVLLRGEFGVGKSAVSTPRICASSPAEIRFTPLKFWLPGRRPPSDALPRTVTEAVWGRIGRLSVGARDAALAVAVCGPRADPALVQEIFPEARLCQAECLEAGVLVEDGNTVGFRNELARRATLDRIPSYQCALLHKRVLAAMTAADIDPNTLPSLAFHSEEAGTSKPLSNTGSPSSA
jgi:hypothetical protein